MTDNPHGPERAELAGRLRELAKVLAHGKTREDAGFIYLGTEAQLCREAADALSAPGDCSGAREAALETVARALYDHEFGLCNAEFPAWDHESTTDVCRQRFRERAAAAIRALKSQSPPSPSPVGEDALKHLGNVLCFLADLHEDDRCTALDDAVVFYNSARPDAQVQPSGQSLQRLVTAPSGQSAEVERLREAKRRALKIADERSMEATRLREALKPFAVLADGADAFGKSDDDTLCVFYRAQGPGFSEVAVKATVGQARRARAALNGEAG
jgi:hypothetical protein